MSLFAKWTWAKPLGAVVVALEEAGVRAGRGPLAVVGAPEVAMLLARSRSVISLGHLPPRRGLRRSGALGLRGVADRLPLADACLAGLVGSGGYAEGVLAEWTRVMCPGGVIVLVDRIDPREHTRRALCAGLVELEQREAGRYMVTSGRLPTWARAEASEA